MSASDRVRRAFDPETFRAQGHAVIDRLADHLARAARGEGGPTDGWEGPEEAVTRWPGAPTAEPSLTFDALVERLLQASVNQHHPRYLGYQISAPLPLAALSDLVIAVINNGMATFASGPASTAIECQVVRWLAGRLGWGEPAGGVLTSGGTLGNLTALLAARHAMLGDDASDARPAVLASRETHYCIARAAEVMGWGAEAVVEVPVDQKYRMQAEALPMAKQRAEEAGRRPVAVVASAGTTSTGSFDPLEPIADFCASAGLWLHIDGAHGAAAALCERYRPLLAGIERADSVVWDAHKMLSLPALITAVLFRDGRLSYGAFLQSASYLYDGADLETQWYNLSLRTLECTKRMMGVTLYAALTVLGTRFFDDFIASRFDLARRFAELLREAPDFEVPVDPECNIVCFRYAPAGTTELGPLQERIREQLRAEGRFFIARTKLDGVPYLRTTLMNPLTTEEDLRALVAAIREATP